MITKGERRALAQQRDRYGHTGAQGKKHFADVANAQRQRIAKLARDRVRRLPLDNDRFMIQDNHRSIIV